MRTASVRSALLCCWPSDPPVPTSWRDRHAIGVGWRRGIGGRAGRASSEVGDYLDVNPYGAVAGDERDG